MTPTQTDVVSPTADLTLGDADPTIADLQDIYLDGTLVLVGCGKAKRDPEDDVDLHAAVVAVVWTAHYIHRYVERYGLDGRDIQ